MKFKGEFMLLKKVTAKWRVKSKGGFDSRV